MASFLCKYSICSLKHIVLHFLHVLHVIVFKLRKKFAFSTNSQTIFKMPGYFHEESVVVP